MLLRFGCTGCLTEFFGSLVQRRPIADVFRAQPAGRFEVADGFRELLDGEQYLPERWDADLDRCREAGIVDSVV